MNDQWPKSAFVASATEQKEADAAPFGQNKKEELFLYSLDQRHILHHHTPFFIN